MVPHTHFFRFTLNIIHVVRRNLNEPRCLAILLDYVEDSLGIGILCPHAAGAAVCVSVP